MIESNSVEVGSGELTRTFAHLQTIENTRAFALTLVVCGALAMRTFALGASGFSEDEINKLQAVRAYAHGQFSANAEHPMLMKIADWASLSLASPYVSAEAALRLPNAIAGAATAVVIFFLAETLFDTTIALWAALFWAFDANATAINRIGKEDTFLLLFLLLAAYCFERAKRDSSDRWYNRSGVAFGLMLASKYMPQYFGLHGLFNIAADRHPADDVPDKRLPFYIAMGAAFLIANLALFAPATWSYVVGYTHGDTLRHTGYNFAHHIWVNNIDASPWGVPVWFYITAIATKVSIVTLVAATAGLVWIGRHSAHRGATFVRVFLVFTLIPYSLVASKFLRYLLPVFAVVDIAAAVGVCRILRRIDDEAAKLAVAVALAVTIAASGASAAPYFGLAQNAVAARFVTAGALFPDDELYDAGMREAVDAVARVAGPHAVICSDATTVVAEYLDRSDRRDIRSLSIAHDGIPMANVETWVFVQDGHTYFENAAVIDGLRRLQPWTEIRVGGTSAVRVYRFR